MSVTSAPPQKSLSTNREASGSPSANLALSYHSMSPDETLLQLEGRSEGLTSAEVQDRLNRFGANVLPRNAGEGPLKLLWNQINNPLIWVLLGSAVVAMVVDPDGGLKNGAVILAVVILNTLIGFIQEFRAGRAIEALMHMVPETSLVLRDGQKTNIPSSQLVPGDIVLLASGDRVPADMRLLQEKNLHAEEAALTGESLPSQKTIDPVAADAQLGDRVSMVFGGTLITYGTATAVVTATGRTTELGKISALISETTTLQTPMTKALALIGKWITIGIVVISLILLVLGTWRAMHETGIDMITALRETVIFAIALAVGAIPEGLPAIVTIALAIGVQRMARRRAVVRKLPSVETLGSTTVICSDKTGTLTRNEMTVQRLWTPDGAYAVSGVGYAPEGDFADAEGRKLETLPTDAQELLVAGAICNDANLKLDGQGRWEITGDPTEGALLTSAQKAGLEVESLRRRRRRHDAIPFESENQFMATLNELDASTSQILLKGAPEVVVRRCSLPPHLNEAAVAAQVKQFASQGMRVLAFAAKDIPASKKDVAMGDATEGFRLLGLQSMIDPPRPEAVNAVRACHHAGIEVKMITGDHKETAQAIGRELGLIKGDAQALTGSEIASLDESELRAAAASTNVFARVAPEHKLRLVRALQSNGHVVAMTGDGVNDAPALKQANIGVAMGITGTAVSKEAADIVLTDDNFASIEAAVEEGRRVYDNLIKSLAFVLPTNIGLALILMYAVLFFPFQNGELLVPMLPTQILWINLVAAISLALPLAFEAKEPDIMSRTPRDPDEPILNAFVLMRTFLAALLMTAGAVGLFQHEYNSALQAGASAAVALATAQTMAVTTVIFFQIFYMLNCRSLNASVLRIGLFSNKTVFIGIGALVLLQIGFIYASPMQAVFGTAALSWSEIGMSALVGAVIMPVIAIEKWVRNRFATSGAQTSSSSSRRKSLAAGAAGGAARGDHQDDFTELQKQT